MKTNLTHTFIWINISCQLYSEDERSSETSAVPNINYCTRLRETLNGGWITAQIRLYQLLVRIFSLQHCKIRRFSTFWKIWLVSITAKIDADPNKNPDLTVVYIVVVERVNHAYLCDYLQLQIDLNVVHEWVFTAVWQSMEYSVKINYSVRVCVHGNKRTCHPVQQCGLLTCFWTTVELNSTQEGHYSGSTVSCNEIEAHLQPLVQSRGQPIFSIKTKSRWLIWLFPCLII